MLGKPYFDLVKALDAAPSFEAVSELLSNRLPLMIGADDIFCIEFRKIGSISRIYGEGPIARKIKERIELVEELLPEHPLMNRVDWTNPGDLGVAVSDFIDPEEYAKNPINRQIKEKMASEDSLLGRIHSCYRRFTLLTACRAGGAFKSSEREAFDAVLFFARSVLERIASANPEDQVRRYLFSMREAVAFFSVDSKAEVLPINFLALRLAEAWWGQDEAFHKLSDDAFERLREDIDKAWVDPVIAEFMETELDLGGGLSKVLALPKQNGEILLVVPQASDALGGDEAVAAVLTKRQHEIMEWIAEGKTSAEVAIILSISPRTVEKHLEAVFQRLGVENRIGAVRRYLDLKAGHPL